MRGVMASRSLPARPTRATANDPKIPLARIDDAGKITPALASA
jgi:hypothetical protein